MKNEATDICEMLDALSLPVAAQHFTQLSESPEFSSYTALQFIHEVLEPQYIETLNKRFETNLRLKPDQQRGCAKNRQNVDVFGGTDTGKSYFQSACCVETCRCNFRCKFVDYSDLLDELIVLNLQEDLNKYRKRIRYYA